MMQWLAIIAVSILACVAYGIVHDQITARICVEYFTVGHPAHGASYLGGFAGGIMLVIWVWRSRGQTGRASGA